MANSTGRSKGASIMTTPFVMPNSGSKTTAAFTDFLSTFDNSKQQKKKYLKKGEIVYYVCECRKNSLPQLFNLAAVTVAQLGHQNSNDVEKVAKIGQYNRQSRSLAERERY